MAFDSGSTRPDRRNPAVRVLGQEPRLTGLAGDDVELDPPERDAELAEQQAHLVAIARAEVVIERQHPSLPSAAARLTA
jgi:hypothetical protein